MPSTTPLKLIDGPVIVWFRSDLRVDDNSALLAASQSGQPVICLYVFDDLEDESTAYGGAQKWWLHHSLTALSCSIRQLGGFLVLRRGNPELVVKQVAGQTNARSVVWNRRYATSHIARDTKLKQELSENGLNIVSFDGALLHEPTQLRTGAGGPYRVYSPFWRAFSGLEEPREPVPSPEKIKNGGSELQSDNIADWNLLPTNPDWSAGIAAEWTPGEAGAAERLNDFLDGSIENYKEGRDIPSVNYTSKLSAHLAFGEITPYQIWSKLESSNPYPSPNKEKFKKEIVWREFSYHLLVNFDDLKNINYNPDFDAFPWQDAPEHLEAWKKGLTGYPLVDAGMRQLWQTGWMHNRVRMVVGSFLVKHLLIDWREGEKWFWDTLVDADPASNTASWQWIAGSGADAAPYFRVFNPVLQGAKFDKDGAYVRRYCPELASLPDKFIHAPWEAPKTVLEQANVLLGDTYPNPIVDHKFARDRALSAYKTMKETSA